MNIFALIVLSFAMSMDAFAASIVQGTKQTAISLQKALKIGAIFGITEMITPIFGYFVGKLAQHWVEQIDHWLSFGLLLAIGVHMLWEVWCGDDAVEGAIIDSPNPAKTNHIQTILTAFATSIDAMIVGVSLAFLDVNIWQAAALIGLATFVMTSMGVFLGVRLGLRIGKWAQILGALVLMSIGTLILWTHLQAGASL